MRSGGNDRDLLGMLGSPYAPSDPIIRDREQRETPMTFSYGARDDGEAEQTASDPADSTRTARRDSLSEEDAATLLRAVDGDEPDEDAIGTQELEGVSGDDVFEAITMPETLQVPDEPATLESLPQDTTPDLVPDATGTLPALPPSPESTPTLPSSEAPRTPALTAARAAAGSAVSPPASSSPSRPPSTMPTLIAPKSMGVPTRKHTDLFEDLLRAPVPRMKRLAGALGGARISHGDHPPVRPILDLSGDPPTRPEPAAPTTRPAPTTSPATTIPRTQPYPFESPVDPELAPTTEPASLPIPLVPAAPIKVLKVEARAEQTFEIEPAAITIPEAAQSRPVPLARLIEASIVSEGARPTLESAQPIAIAPSPKTETVAPSIWAHGAQPHTLPNGRDNGPVRPLVLPDMSGALPVQQTFDPRLAHADYAEGLARRQQAERAAAEKLEQLSAVPTPSPRSRAWLVAFAAFAVLIAATLFCAAVLMLRQGSHGTGNGPTASFAPLKPGSGRVAAALPAAALPAAALPRAATPSAAVPAVPAIPAAGDNGIPVLAVDLLPRVHNNRGILHVGKQFDGHRVFIDGAVIGAGPQTEGRRDYELLCGRHTVKMGSQDRSRLVTVPCGGDVSL